MASRHKYAPGNYLCEVVDHDIKIPSDGKHPYAIIHIQPVGLMQPDGNAEAVEDNGTDSMRLYLSEKAYPVSDKKLKTMQDCTLSQLAKEHPLHVSLVGKRFVFSCKHEPNSDWDKWDVPLGISSNTSATLEQVKKLEKMLGMAAKPVKPTAPTPPPVTQAPPAEVQEAVDNDVPF